MDAIVPPERGGSCREGNGTDRVCGWPIERQEFPSCDRNLAQLKDAGDLGPAFSTITVDGTTGIVVGPADEGQVDIYTSDITVVVFAPSQDEALKVASALAPMNGSASLTADGNLPSPSPGALAGTLGCPGVKTPP